METNFSYWYYAMTTQVEISMQYQNVSYGTEIKRNWEMIQLQSNTPAPASVEIHVYKKPGFVMNENKA